ncbi:MAG: hypothetical protein ACOC2C_01295 [Cyclonatronaceae bacterium]
MPKPPLLQRSNITSMAQRAMMWESPPIQALKGRRPDHKPARYIAHE